MINQKEYNFLILLKNLIKYLNKLLLLIKILVKIKVLIKYQNANYNKVYLLYPQIEFRIQQRIKLKKLEKTIVLDRLIISLLKKNEFFLLIV